MKYRHSQVGWVTIGAVILVVCAAVCTLILSSEAWSSLPWIGGLVAVILSLFATLTVTVAEGWLECHFGVGLIHRRIRLSDVRHAEIVRNHWWYGWGIRLTPHGWLWNVSGLDAVEITFANGKRFRVGTDDSEKLLEAIRASRMAGASSK